jgi:hypothetical protein
MAELFLNELFVQLMLRFWRWRRGWRLWDVILVLFFCLRR